MQLERVRDFYKKRDPRMGVRKGMIMMLGDGKRNPSVKVILSSLSRTSRPSLFGQADGGYRARC